LKTNTLNASKVNRPVIFKRSFCDKILFAAIAKKMLFSSEAAEYRGRTVLILPQGFRLPYDRSSKFAAGKDTNTEMEEAGTLNKKKRREH
jgi:hypothetical protein